MVNLFKRLYSWYRGKYIGQRLLVKDKEYMIYYGDQTWYNYVQYKWTGFGWTYDSRIKTLIEIGNCS